MSSPRSRIGALWVIQPDEIRSTPAAAMAGRGLAGDAARGLGDRAARPPSRRRGAACRGSMLSSSTASTPSFERLGELVERVDLELDLDEVAGRAPSRAAAPRVTPPAIATWLSLISIASSRPKRWLAPPPSRTASFSRMRRPGRGLAGADDLGLVARRSHRPASGSRVATPDSRHTRLSAVRSAASTGRARPRITRDLLAAFDAGCRPAHSTLDLERRVEQLERHQRRFEPGEHAGLARGDDRLDPRVVGHDRVGGDVAGAAEVFEQRGADDRLDRASAATRHAPRQPSSPACARPTRRAAVGDFRRRPSPRASSFRARGGCCRA